jgi:hypothetical protein
VGEAGSASFIPPMSAKCTAGPKRECVRVASEADVDEPWEYALPTKEQDPAWSMVGVDDQYYWDTTASTHIRFSWSNADGKCEVWVEGFADLDGDAFYSTYLTGIEIDKGGEFAGDGLTRRELVGEDPATRSR